MSITQKATHARQKKERIKLLKQKSLVEKAEVESIVQNLRAQLDQKEQEQPVTTKQLRTQIQGLQTQKKAMQTKLEALETELKETKEKLTFHYEMTCRNGQQRVHLDNTYKAIVSSWP